MATCLRAGKLGVSLGSCGAGWGPAAFTKAFIFYFLNQWEDAVADLPGPVGPTLTNTMDSLSLWPPDPSGPQAWRHGQGKWRKGSLKGPSVTVKVHTGDKYRVPRGTECGWQNGPPEMTVPLHRSWGGSCLFVLPYTGKVGCVGVLAVGDT